MSLFSEITKSDVLFHALNTSNHRPVNLEFNLQMGNALPTEERVFSKRTAWHKATQDDLDSYKQSLSECLDNIAIEPGCLCRDSMCKDAQHQDDINLYANAIVQCMLDASDTLPKTSKSKGIPYWNEEAKPLREKALDERKHLTELTLSSCSSC